MTSLIDTGPHQLLGDNPLQHTETDTNFDQQQHTTEIPAPQHGYALHHPQEGSKSTILIYLDDTEYPVKPATRLSLVNSDLPNSKDATADEDDIKAEESVAMDTGTHNETTWVQKAFKDCYRARMGLLDGPITDCDEQTLNLSQLYHSHASWDTPGEIQKALVRAC